MWYVYLGLFQKIFNWVYNKILDPVFSFISKLLTTVLTWVFEKVLGPILIPLLQDAMNFLIELWLDLYSSLIYMLFAGILKIVDYMETAFDVFIGIRDVSYTSGGTTITGSLLDVLLQQDTISTVFWALTLGALGLALTLTIYATAKSSFDLDFENKRPVSKVLSALMKTVIQFFTVPFMVYFLVKLAAVIIRTITNILTAGESATLGRTVFVIASLDAAKDVNYNVSTAASGLTLGTSPQDIVRYPFYSTTVSGARDYGELSVVSEYFDLSEFDYLIGFIAAIFLFFTIGICLIIFVQRIFEVILLYLVSPYFVCMIPLDDGEKFSQWRNMFVAKCFTGFGSAVGMRLYLLICPMVMGSSIVFSADASPELDYMMKLFFLLGGAWAVFKSGPMITTLLNFHAGTSESQTAAVAGGALYGYTLGAAMNKGRQMLGSLGRRSGQGGGEKQDGEGGSGRKSVDELFSGLKKAGPTAKWTPATPTGKRSGSVTIGSHRSAASSGGWKSATPTGKRSGLAAGSQRGSAWISAKPTGKQSGPAVGTQRERTWKSATTPTGKRSGLAAGAQRVAPKTGWVSARPTGLKGAGEETAWKPAAMPTGERSGSVTMGGYRAQAEPAATTPTPETPAIRTGPSIRLGSLFKSTYDKDGNHKFRIMGLGFNTSNDGKISALRLPGCRFDQIKGEGMKLTGVHVPGVVRMKDNVKDGTLKYSSVSFLSGKVQTGRDYESGVTRVQAGQRAIMSDGQGRFAYQGAKTTYTHDSNGSQFAKGCVTVKLGKEEGHRLDSVKIGSLSFSRSGNVSVDEKKESKK
ncbi:MAG: hypothetical protein LUE86_01995 [Clostridiales bacterium]|nr:hypothetical protein [Clostridiales bacterium]